MDLSGSIWPKNLRSLTETAWANDSCGDLFMALRDHFLEATSDKTVFINTINTGGKAPLKPDNAAFSMISNVYAGLWTMWEEASEDAAQRAWHRKALQIIEPFAVGYYIGETDLVENPDHIEKAFSPENWQRLQAIRQHYDPEGLFYGFGEGLK